VLGAYRDRLVTVGRRVRVERVGRDPLLGQATGVDATGALRVRDDAGAEHTIAAGDVEHLRNA
jgi:BirA family biotin operon repressor/biotin-[acetyl-CoA-carboxylase] ligase